MTTEEVDHLRAEVRRLRAEFERVEQVNRELRATHCELRATWQQLVEENSELRNRLTFLAQELERTRAKVPGRSSMS